MAAETRIEMVASPTEARRISKLSVAGWVLYDLANTIFSLNITSFYFAIWVVNVMGGTDQLFSQANAAATFLALICAPVLGALSDHAPRRLPFLLASTVACVAATLMLGTGGLLASLAFYVVASLSFQVGLIFYDALLPEVSTEQNRGRIGGLGVGVGYVGSLLGIGTGLILLGPAPTSNDYVEVFRATAILFMLWSLPAFFFIRERPRRTEGLGRGAVRRSIMEVRHTIRRAGQYPGLRRFLVGRLFYTDAANTLILFMGVYVTNELAFSAGQAQFVLLVGILGAIVGGLSCGVLVDRIGPKRALDMVLVLWMVALSLTIAIPVLNLPSALFWGVAALAGGGLGGLWGADRPYMLRLSPPRYIGQFYGLYAMVGRFSAIVGPLIWGLMVTTLNLGRPAAVGSLLVLLVIGFVVLRKVTDAPRAWGPEDQIPA